MPTKPKKKQPKKTKVPFPTPRKRPLPPGFKGIRVEDILGKGKDLWASDEELDEFLDQIRRSRYTPDPASENGTHGMASKITKKMTKVEFPKPRKRKLPANLPFITVDDFMGKGKDLWKSDEELDQFLEMIREGRKD